jgi:hypothetical protein
MKSRLEAANRLVRSVAIKALVGLPICKETTVNWCVLFVTVGRYGSAWHVARTEIVSSYRAFSREKIEAELGAYIGLGHVNVTLRGKPRWLQSSSLRWS